MAACARARAAMFCRGVVDDMMDSRYREFSSPCSGPPQVLRPDRTYPGPTRFGVYC